MSIPQIVALGALPALGAMWYVDRLDRSRPEPPASLRRVAVAGAIAVVPCALIELGLLHFGAGLTGYTQALFKGFLVAGLIEELAKLLCVRLFVWNRPEFDERMDGIVYATRAALGFALVENVLYLLGQEQTLSQFALVFLMRAVFAVPGHAVFTGIMGYFAARRRFDGRGIGMLGGYALAVALHGAYDSAIFASLVSAAEPGGAVQSYALLAVPVLIVGVGALVLRGMVRRAIAADDAALGPAAVTGSVPRMR